MFVSAQEWKEMIALDLLFFYELQKYLTMSYLNVAFHTVSAFVGGRAVSNFLLCVSFPHREENRTPMFGMPMIWKFLAGLPFVPTTRFGPSKRLLHFGSEW